MGSFRVFAWMASYNFAIERLGTHPELLRSKMPFPLVNVWWKWMKMTCCTWHVGLSMRHDNRAFWRWHCNMIWDCRFGHRSGIQESRNPGSWLWYLIAGFCRSLSFIRGGQCINIAWPCLHLLGEFHADIALAKQNKSTFREVNILHCHTLPIPVAAKNGKRQGPCHGSSLQLRIVEAKWL